MLTKKENPPPYLQDRYSLFVVLDNSQWNHILKTDAQGKC